MPAPDDMSSEAALMPTPRVGVTEEIDPDDVLRRLLAAGCTIWDPDGVLETLRSDPAILADWVAEALAVGDPKARRVLLETAQRAVGSDVLIAAILKADGTLACGRPSGDDDKAVLAFLRNHLEAIPGFLTEALAALNLAVRAVGARGIAAEIGTMPATVYKAFQPGRDPSLRLTLRILRAMGLPLVVARP